MFKRDYSLETFDEEEKEPFFVRTKNKILYTPMEKRKSPFILAFLIPVLVMILGYFVNEVYPFGEQSILCSDLYNQYLPFFADLRSKLLNHGSLYFSWELGLGSNFLALYAYYLASPFNWLLVFVPFDYLIEFMGIVIIIKIGLCGLSFSYYLYKHFGRRDYSITIFSLFYALSGFIGAYNWDIMWLDVIILAPLVLLGVEMLVNERKGMFYGFTLGLAILFNYYLAMLMCVFLVFYFAIQVILLPKEKWTFKHIFSVIGLFAFFSILAAGLASVLLIPVAKALSNTKYTSATFPSEWKFYFSPLLAFARHCMNVDTEIGQAHWPNIYCGVGVFFLLPYWFTCKKVMIREKICYTIMIAIFLFSFSVNRLDFIWHGMNYPNCLPGRQGYLYVFLIVSLCYKAYLQVENEHKVKYFIALAIAATAMILIVKFTEEKYYPDHAYLFTGIFLGAEIVVLFLASVFKNNTVKKICYLMLAIIVVGEVATNMSYSGILTSSRYNYVKNDQSYKSLLKDIEDMEGDDFYRIEMRERKCKNDSMYYNFHSTTMFSSTTSEQIQNFYTELGISSSKVFYWNPSGTPLINAMLGIRYYFSEYSNLDNPFFSYVRTDGNITLYKNNFALPLGYVVDSNLEEKWDYLEGNPAQAQDFLAYSLGVNEILFEEMQNVDNQEGVSTYLVEEPGYYFAYVGNKYVDVIEMDTSRPENGSSDYYENKRWKQVQNDYMLDCTYCTEGTYITFYPKEDDNENENLDLRIYRFDENAMKQAYNILSRQTLTVDQYTDTSVRGHIDINQPGQLVLSIPYEDGFTLYVDGKETEIELFADTMMAVTLPRGKHVIALKYRPSGLTTGILVSLASWGIFGFIIFWKKRKKAFEEEASKY